MAGIRLLNTAPPTSRVGRYPKHTFLTKELAFTAQPFFMARVLPGETLENLYMEARVVTDPVLNSIIGWKKEYFFFYVRITDLLLDGIEDYFVDSDNASMTGTWSAADVQANYYTAKGGVPFLRYALIRIIDEYFRDNGEAFADHLTAGDVPIVQIREKSWMDSVMDEDTFNLYVGGDPSAETTAEGLEAVMNAFEHLRSLGMANMTYEDFLRSYGIAIPSKDESKPEMIAHFSDFQYPTNTIDPTSGVPASAVSWVFKNGNRSPKFFKEPGFLVGVSVTRPKVYFGQNFGMLGSFASRAWDWVPRYLNEGAAVPMPETSIKRFEPNTGPFGDWSTALADGYYIDMRDELLHGDQFQNLSARSTGSNPADSAANHILTTMAADTWDAWKYPTEAQCKSFFVDSAGTEYNIRQDGYVSLQIKGKQVDYTQAHIASQ